MKTRPRAAASASSDVARRRDALVGAALALVATPGAARAKLSGGVTGGVPIENFQPVRETTTTTNAANERDDDGETDDARRDADPGNEPADTVLRFTGRERRDGGRAEGGARGGALRLEVSVGDGGDVEAGRGRHGRDADRIHRRATRGRAGRTVHTGV
jgi:hypothetical protein